VSFQSSIKHKEDYYDALYNLGTAYMMAGNYNAAQASFLTLKDRDATRADAYIGVADSFRAQGRALDGQGDPEGAQKKYDEALKVLAQVKGPNLPVPSVLVQQLLAYSQGLIYYEKKDYMSAVSNFTQAIGLNRDYAEAFLWRGKAYAQIGAFDRAVADLEAVKAKSQDSTLINDATSQIHEINTKRRPNDSSSQ
jgi:tetratricopeptide (TPR) repeat protein